MLSAFKHQLYVDLHRIHYMPLNLLRFELLAVAIITTLLVRFFFQLDPDLFYEGSLKASGDVLIFAAATYGLGISLTLSAGEKLTKNIKFPLCFGLAFIAGVTMEIAKPLFGDAPSFLAIWYRLLGCATGICLLYVRTQDIKIKRILTGAAATFMVAVSFIMPLYYSYVESQRDQLHPTIADFQLPWQRELLSSTQGVHITIQDAPKEWRGNKGVVAKIDMNTENNPSLYLSKFRPDWQYHETLSMSLFVKDINGAKLSISLSDDYAKGEAIELNLDSGLNEIELDLKKLSEGQTRLRLDQVNKIEFATPDTSSDVQFYVDDLRLEKS